MAEIIPAILPKNYEDLKNKIALVRGLVPIVQVDICDGVFVKTATWPFSSRAESRDDFDEHFQRILNEQEGMPFWEDIEFELDLMVADSVRNFDIYTKLGPKRIIFHVEAEDIRESSEDFKNFLEGIDNYVRDSMEIGIAIGSRTPVEWIFPLVNIIDFVQVMGIRDIGQQGAEFDAECLDQMKKLKEKFPDVVIAVDGGVKLEIAYLLIAAGADRLVIGSAIFHTDDIIGTIERFKQL